MREEHLALAQALADRDADLIEQITRRQILRSRERVMEVLLGNAQGNEWKALGQAVRLKPAAL
jgi:DNA-binding GntR family transcriptional regulator